MITNINKKVICVKDIPSNVIEEAFFILKNDSSTKNEKMKTNRKEIASKEAEIFLEEYIKKIEKEHQYKDRKTTFANKIFGAILITIGVISIITIIVNLVIK